MSEWIIYLLVFLPLLVPVVALASTVETRILWALGVFCHAAVFALSAWALSLFYFNNSLAASGIYSTALAWNTPWDLSFQFHIDFLSCTLILVLSLVFLASYLIGQTLEKATPLLLASLSFLYVAVAGVVLASSFGMALIFLAAELLPELALIGLNSAKERIAILKKHMASMAFSTVLFMICVLALSKPVLPTADSWMKLSAQDSPLGFRNLIFLFFCLGCFLRMPIFPFQARFGSLFRLSASEFILPFLCATNLGFYLFFRYGPEFFSAELAKYSLVLALAAAINVLYFVVYLAKHGSAKESIYGSLGVWNGILLLGFVSLSRMGWVGSWSVYLSEILVVGVALVVAIIRERGAVPGISAANVFAGISLTGLPLTLIFYAAVLVLWSGAQTHLLPTILVLVSMPVFLWVGVRRLFQSFSAGHAPSDGLVMSRMDAGILLSLCLLLLVLGFCPDLLLAPLGEQMGTLVKLFHFGV